MKEIVQYGNPVLREIAKKVSLENITSDAIMSLLKGMKEVLDTKEFGVALAAPQVGESLRIFIVAEKVFETDDEKILDAAEIKPTDLKKPLIYINPKIIKTSKKTSDLEEGCLSVEGYLGTIKRAQQVTIEAYNEHGTKFTRGASGLLAQIFQHEVDHLNGILYTDHATDVFKVDTQEDTKE